MDRILWIGRCTLIATLTKDGILKIMAENDLEEYAIRHWVDEAFITVADYERMEDSYCRGSKILISRIDK